MNGIWNGPVATTTCRARSTSAPVRTSNAVAGPAQRGDAACSAGPAGRRRRRSRAGSRRPPPCPGRCRPARGTAMPGRASYWAGVNSRSESHRARHECPSSAAGLQDDEPQPAPAPGARRWPGRPGRRRSRRRPAASRAGSCAPSRPAVIVPLPRSTVKLNIMPLCMCSAMWQCAIHRPGLVTSNRMSTVCPVADQDGVLPDQVGLGRAVAGQDQEASGAVQVERVVHRVVGVHLVDQPDLHPVPDGEPPVDRGRWPRRWSGRRISSACWRWWSAC